MDRGGGEIQFHSHIRGDLTNNAYVLLRIAVSRTSGTSVGTVILAARCGPKSRLFNDAHDARTLGARYEHHRKSLGCLT